MVPEWCQKNDHFVGRANDLERLRNMLCDNKPAKFNHRVAIFGMGGVGKTQVAIQYVVTYKSQYDSVFWITAADLAGLLLGFQEIAAMTKCTDGQTTDAVSVAKQVLRWFESQSSWLLVLDNGDDISVISHYLPDVSDCGGHILITTRNPNATDIPTQGLEIAVFDVETAAHMLLLRADRENPENPEVQKEATSIVKELGFLALAIEQAATFIRVSLKDIFKFLPVYSANRKKILAQRPRENWPYEQVVATTWSLSFEVIKKTDDHAAQLLNLFAFLNPDGILLEFLEAGKAGLCEPLKTLIGDSFEFPRALGLLEQFSLIRRPDYGQMISIHRLIQTILKDNLSGEGKRAFMEMAVSLIRCAFPKFDEGTRLICRKYQAQVVEPLLNLSELGSEGVADISVRVGTFMYNDGKYSGAEQFESKAVEIYTGIFGAADQRTLRSMNNLAEIYGSLGRVKDAVDLHEKVLEVWRRTLGEKHKDTLSSMNNLAETYASLGRVKDAVDLHERVLEVRRRTLGEEHPVTLTSMYNLASAYWSSDRPNEAIDLFERELDACRSVYGERDRGTIASLINLFHRYTDIGRTEDAAVLATRIATATSQLEQKG